MNGTPPDFPRDPPRRDRQTASRAVAGGAVDDAPIMRIALARETPTGVAELDPKFAEADSSSEDAEDDSS